ncbi:hypothetical protein [Methylophaga sp. OBS3]|uniref:hypothetical protein n=1 Tax=Methylophaga sp. OBS3 TaxID=2991934 RepID=UPI00225BB79B|nr:hypothetical protein [Methylophaga sp. OBS3]MCX4190744.1 hypothetical protein [Methylophaga sp. OBS3]
MFYKLASNPTYMPSQLMVRLFTAIASLLLSVYAFATDDLINSDGVLYIDMARAFLEGGLSQSAELYDWPFFSILVAAIHLLTGIPLERSGELLNIVLFVVFTDALLLIGQKLLPNTRHLLIAGLFILGFTLFVDYRAYLFRDLGYWAFISLSLYFFITFQEAPKLSKAIYWQLSILFAILFRVEGVAFAALMPLLLLAKQEPVVNRVKNLAMLWAPFLIIAISAITFALSTSEISSSFAKLGEVLRYINFSDNLENFYERADVINLHVLSQFAKDDGALVLFSGLLVMMAVDVITALSIGYLILYLISRHQTKPLQINPITKNTLEIFILINILILAVFCLTKFFLSTRYAFMLVTALFLLMLPRLCQYVDQALINKSKFGLALTFLVLISGPIDGLTSSVSKSYIKESALWAAQNLPENTSTLAFDTISDYYLRENQAKTDVHLAVRTPKIKDRNYDYLIVVVKKKDTDLQSQLKQINSRVIFSSENNRGDKSLVLQTMSD